MIENLVQHCQPSSALRLLLFPHQRIYGKLMWKEYTPDRFKTLHFLFEIFK